MNKTMLSSLIATLVDFPEQVEVNEVKSYNFIIYEIKVVKTDIGKIVGKQGRMIQAIRTIVVGASAKDGVKATVEIIEEVE